MKLAVIGALIALVPAVASAQYYQPRPYYQQDEQPAPGQTVYSYDRQSGNRYSTTPNYDGSTSVRGSNLQNGTRWRTEIQPDGAMRGTDADGNRWTYNPDTKTYRNSGTGVTCRGEGSRRYCY